MWFFYARPPNSLSLPSMETIPKNDCRKIGFIRKTHGVRGELILEFEPQFEFAVEDASRFFLEIDGLLIPFFAEEEGIHLKSEKTAFVKFSDVDTPKYARRLSGSSVYLFSEEAEENVSDPRFFDFLGYLLKDSNAGEIGTITDAADYSGNIVMTVKHHDEEVLIPFNEELLVAADDQQKILILNLPEGMV